MKENHKQITGSGDTRRSFLKKAGLAALPIGVGASIPALGRDRAARPSLAVPTIRLRSHITDPGWTYYQVKTVNGSYPKAEDEAPFRPGQYGGNERVKWNSTRRFRTEKVEGRWWMVDPDGHPFVSCGVNAIRQGKSAVTRQAVQQKGGEDAWSTTAMEWLRRHGFNTVGTWSAKRQDHHGQSIHEGMPYVFFDFGMEGDPELFPGKRAYGLMECFGAQLGRKLGRARGTPFVAFHPEFAEFCEERCNALLTPKRVEDPWMVGYFTDNELAFPSLSGALKADADDPVRGPCVREARRWHDERKAAGHAADQECWTAHVYDWYLRIVTGAIRQRDGGHLMLGSRLYATERNFAKVFAVAGRHLDVVCVNPYGMAAVPATRMQEWSRWAGGKPMMVGEFYVKGADNDLGNEGGAGMVAATQEERGLYYQNYTLELLRSRVCVGWHWHQYADEVSADAGGVNKGLVSAKLDPYAPLLERAAELNLRMHDIAGRMA